MDFGKAIRLREERESGMTLVELIVAMGILTILLTISLTAVVTLSKNTVRVQAQSTATDQLRATFQRLDKEVRYASAINTPGTAGDSIYVEYLVDSTVANGTPQCVQWRYVKTTGDLQRRTWTPGSAPKTVWQTTVSDLRNKLSDAAQQPFTVERAGNTLGKVYSHQQLQVFLDTGMGGSGDARGGQLKANFVALNSSNASPLSVCLIGGAGRP